MRHSLLRLTACALASFAATILLVGCGTAIRSPVCHDNEQALPPGAEGHYRLASMSATATLSGVNDVLSNTDFDISERGQIYLVTVTTNGVAAKKVTRALRRNRRSTTSPTDESSAILPMQVCKIGNAYYSQTLDDDGTYYLSRFDLSPTGITTTPLMFLPVELATARIPVLFMPKFDHYVSDPGSGNGFHFMSMTDGLNGTHLIVDNSQMADGDRARFLSLAHAGAGGYVFTRIEPPAASGRTKARSFVMTVPRGD